MTTADRLPPPFRHRRSDRITTQRGDAVTISLGDATQKGWGEDFAAYLSQRLSRDVELAAFTGNVTTTELIAGVGGQKPSLLDQAVAAIDDYESRGTVVVAVTLSAGSEGYRGPGRLRSECAVEAAALAQRYREQLESSTPASSRA
jgi:hypothetical protein